LPKHEYAYECECDFGAEGAGEKNRIEPNVPRFPAEGGREGGREEGREEGGGRRGF